ncbi:MAG: copper chaperone PCu(A)C [Alphaproteobacteria bacterium]
MKRPLALLAVLFLLVAPALAGEHDHDHAQGTLHIIQPWARFTPPGAPNGAAYLSIENTGAEADRLVGVATPRAERAEMHETKQEGELMTMRPVDGVAIAPGKTVSFAPGGLHIMMLGLSAPLTEGERFPMTLRFEHAGEVTVEVVVTRGAAMQSDMHHHMEDGHMEDGHMEGGHMGQPEEEHGHGME